MALEQTYIQSVKYADKESQKRPTDPAAHTSTLILNYKMTGLQGMLSYITVQTFPVISLELTSSLLGMAFAMWALSQRKRYCLSSFSHFSVACVLAHTEELKGNIQKNSFVQTLLLHNKQTALIRRLPSR